MHKVYFGRHLCSVCLMYIVSKVEDAWIAKPACKFGCPATGHWLERRTKQHK